MRYGLFHLPWSWPLTFWHISMSQAQEHWPNFGEISSKGYKDIVFTRFFGHCLLWLHLLTQKSNQHILWTQIHLWPKLGGIPLKIVFEIWCSQCFGMHRLTHGHTRKSMSPSFSVPHFPSFNRFHSCIFSRLRSLPQGEQSSLSPCNDGMLVSSIVLQL